MTEHLCQITLVVLLLYSIVAIPFWPSRVLDENMLYASSYQHIAINPGNLA